MTNQLFVDYTKCTGCRLCELACTAKKEGVFQPSLARLKIVKYDDIGVDVPNVCGPCETAPCVDVCPVYAIRRDPISKMTYLDEAKCILCKSCVGACVNGVILLDTERMRIIKCDHCGGDPECAKICPTEAISYGPIPDTTTVDRHEKAVSYLREIKRTAKANSSGES
ncbi:MAG: 4Fe-4S dicluster domain-containing protein [Candidatus Thorarchaeota archaeon]|nr:4Fe-4S dicluster domain-containing protein [Candidatus Thorarchaeota archaeon]